MTGKVPEWSIGAVSKTVVRFAYRGFESLPFRENQFITLIFHAYWDAIGMFFKMLYLHSVLVISLNFKSLYAVHIIGTL